ncbi:MAG: PadR family transcriptional regulator [Carbonactinosporaceae bacterium]
MGRGDVRAAVLTLLAEQPLHGYQIIQVIAERSHGIWRPSPGSVYPAMRQLKHEGLVRIEHDEGRRVVHLTAAGRAHVEEHADELDAVWESVTCGVTDDMLELRELFCQLGSAFMQVAQTGTDGQLARARQVLDDTRRSLYQILADGDPGGQRPQTGRAVRAQTGRAASR